MLRLGTDALRILVAVTLLLVGNLLAATSSESVLYTFQGGSDGATPSSALTADQQGNLYGTTQFGGMGLCTDSFGFVVGCGTVFKLTKPTKLGGAWTETLLYTFQGNASTDSQNPVAGVVFDAAGNLYGATAGVYSTANNTDYGTVFELSPPVQQGGAWTKKIIYAFAGSNDGANPTTQLIMDKAGRLIGATSNGQGYNGGTVFRLTPPVHGGNSWTEAVLYTFTAGNDGDIPSEVTLDRLGNFFGTTYSGGGELYSSGEAIPVTGGGTFFELTPGPKSSKPWIETQIFVFPPCTGLYSSVTCGTSTQPLSGVVADNAGNYYGTTQLGEPYWSGYCDYHNTSYFGCGTIYQLVPPALPGGSWTQNILYSFTGQAAVDGGYPYGKLTLDRTGNLYGTTKDGCNSLCIGGIGTVFRLSPPTTTGGVWTHTALHIFAGGSDGAVPAAGLIFGSDGALYGTTQEGGTGNCLYMIGQQAGCGTVFKVVP